jgi:parvulin-like peptidyl-prolyl isomerase
MTETLPYSEQEIIHQLKLSGQIPSLLKSIAILDVVIAAARVEGIGVSEEELQLGANQIRLSSKLYQSSDTWEWLQQNGLTVDDFEEMIYQTVLSNKLAQHLFADKVGAVFAERRIDYTQVALYQVILDDEDLALELYYTINEGDLSFYEMAREHSLDKELGRKGGYLGLVNRMDLRPEVRSAVFGSFPPQLLKPILSKKGTHLIQLEEIVQPQLTPILHQQILSELFLEWIDNQIKALPDLP